MKRSLGSWMLALSVVGGLAGSPFLERPALAGEAGGSADAEKAKALSPYANDLGSESVEVSSYPPDMQAIYKDLFLVKCQRCHKASRALHSQFVEPAGPKEEEQARIAQWKASNPEMFKDKLVWQIEGKSGAQPGIWERYVKRMMSKPGCNIQPAEGKKIWEFLRYDSEKRKTGANAARWAEQRRNLLADFKTKHPARYEELYETP